MGASPNKIIHDHKRHLIACYGSGDDGVHLGTSLGRRPDLSACEADQTHALWVEATDTFAAFAALVAVCIGYRKGDLTLADVTAWWSARTSAVSGCPWGVAPADFWGGLDTDAREGMIDAVLQAAVQLRISA